MSTFAVEFTSPHFSDNTPPPYTHIPDGHEEQWHDSGNNRIASYANVPLGHYKFRVKVNNAFMVKPFSRSYLMAHINQLLEERRIFQSKMVVRTTVENIDEENKDEYERHLMKKDIEFLNKIHGIIEQNLNANDFNIVSVMPVISANASERNMT